jgi:hypothetical protein
MNRGDNTYALLVLTIAKQMAGNHFEESLPEVGTEFAKLPAVLPS